MHLDLERLKKVAYIAANAVYDKDVTYFAFGLLSYAGINLNNGYIISSNGNIIEVRLNNISLLVITCEKAMSYTNEIKQEFIDYIKN